MIRPATPGDALGIAGMMKRFHAHTGMVLPFVAAHVMAAVEAYIADSDKCAFLLEHRGLRGVILGEVAPHPFAPVVVAHETLWWVNPDFRGGSGGVRLLSAFESWGMDQGAGLIAVVARDPRIGGLLARLDYAPLAPSAPTETTFVRQV